jgi:hypothetical protein
VRTQAVKVIKPEIFAVGIDAIRINNVLDNVPYSDYTITINGIYIANLLHRPNIEKGDGIEIPINLFRLPDEVNIHLITFSMPGYLDYNEVIEIIFPPKNPWKITEQEARDRFGDKTGSVIKGIEYRVDGSFRSSFTQYQERDIKIIISTQVPSVIGVRAFDGRNLESLREGLWSYKIENEIIENQRFDGPSLSPTGSITDETKSFLYLLKQGGTIRVQVYKDGTTYSFTIDADGFKEVYSEALEGEEGSITYYYVVPDRNNRNIETQFTINYIWSYEKEERYKNNPQLEEYIRNFFRTKDRNFINDSRGYYRRERVEREWGEPILQQIRVLFNDNSIEFRSNSGFRAFTYP